jgi:hypothetical protein
MAPVPEAARVKRMGCSNGHEVLTDYRHRACVRRIMKQSPTSGQPLHYWTTASQYRLMMITANDECLIREAQQVVTDSYAMRAETQELLHWLRRLVADD